MPLGKVLQAAIQYSEEGFPVAELTAESWRESEASLKDDEGAAINYLVNGRAPRAGEIFKNPRMAKTLRRIADEGQDVFYKGDIAEKIVRCSEKKGGLFTLKDFADHRSDWVEPVTANYRGYDIYELPPATHGFVTLEMLKTVEGFDLKAMGAQSADALHLMIEAKKLAFADRDRYLADRDYMKVRVSDLFAPKRVEALRSRFRSDQAAGEFETVPLAADTEYVATADSEGNLVSFIQSNFMGFGSGVVEPETGIVLQNRGHLFSLDENHPNCIGPHKRCVHTLMPGMILKDGKPFAALGLKGGHVQPQVQVQIITNFIDFGMTVQEAIAASRFNHIEGLKVGLEPGIPEATVEGTEAQRPPGCLRQSRILRRRSRHHDSSRIRRLCGRLRPAQGRLRSRLLTQKKHRPTAKNLAWQSRNQNSEYLAQRRKGRKEIKLPDLAFLASWREQIPFFQRHDSLLDMSQ